MTLRVSEIFYSIQGEGKRAGDPSIFIRLQGCSAKFACYASGVRCDTEFESGSEMTLETLLERIHAAGKGCMWIIWTGGEPTDQLTAEHVQWFKERGYKQAIETSGLHSVPPGLDFVCVSPKVAEHVVKKNFTDEEIDELRYVRHEGQSIPEPAVKAKHYLLSPHFDGFTANDANVRHCIRLCLENPQWSLSVQMHKLLAVL